MSYAEYTRNTNERIKGYAHSRRYVQAARIVRATSQDVILDYGCGDAHLFEHLTNVPRSQLTAFDPSPKMIAQIPSALAEQIDVYSDRTRLVEEKSNNFTLIVCMEVCEHLSPDALCQLTEDFRKLAKRNARIVIGIPIETGLSGLFKNIYRAGRGGRMGATLSRAVSALFGRPIRRHFADGWTSSHIGFRENDLIDQLRSDGFNVKKGLCVPFTYFGRVFNNESYLVCSIAAE